MGLLVGERRGDEEIADAVDDVPGVEVTRPAIHLAPRHLAGFVDHAGKDARFVDAGVPEPLRERVVVPGALRDRALRRDADAERVRRYDPEPRHAFDTGSGSPRAQLGDDLVCGHGHRTIVSRSL